MIPRRVYFARIALLALLAAVAACHAPAALPAPEQGVTTLNPGGDPYERTLRTSNHDPLRRAIATPLARAWSVAPAAFADLAVPITVLDSTTHAIGNLTLRVRGGRLGEVRLARILDCGASRNEPSRLQTYTIHMRVLTQLRPGKDGGTDVYSQVEATASNEGHGGALRCGSTGYLERRIAEVIAARAAASP